MIVGLTGGIGSGKSAAGKYFVELGIDVIDADDISKNILDENIKAKELFIKNFGDKFLDKNNNIDRDLLRSEIFVNEEKKNILESIIHPIVREEITKFINQSKSIYSTGVNDYINQLRDIYSGDEIELLKLAIKLPNTIANKKEGIA